MPRHISFSVVTLLVGLTIQFANLTARGQSESDPFEVSGTVLDTEKQPVAGAKVYAFSPDDQDSTVFEGITDSAGKYRIEVDRAEDGIVSLIYKPGLAASIIEKRTERERWYPVDFLGATSPGSSKTNNQHTLIPSTNVSIQVQDEDGKPFTVNSARIGFLRSLGGSFQHKASRNLPIKIKDNQITVDCLADESHFSIVLNEDPDNKNGKLGKTEIWVTVSDRSMVTATIQDTASFSGQVVDADGEPVPGANVTANSRQASTQTGECTVTMNVEQQSSADGRFDLRGIASGKTNVWVESERYFLGGPAPTLTLTAGGNDEVELVVRLACEISGRVVDTNGNPVPGVKLFLSGQPTQTDQDGKYAGYANSDPVFVRLLNVPTGFLMPYDSQFGARIEPDKTSHAFEDFVLETVQPLTGTVVDDQGHPVPNAVVRTIWKKQKDSMSTAAFDMAITDENGQFQLDATTQQFDFGITACSKYLATPEVQVITSQEERRPLNLTVSSRGVVKLKGTILDNDGKGVPDATISLKQALVIPSGNVYGEYQVFEKIECKTDLHGNYEFPVRLLRTARYSIGVQASGYMVEETAMLSAGTDEEFLSPPPIKLTRTRSASGIVVDTGGNPVVGAQVQAFAVVKRNSSQESRVFVTTDENGRFELKNIHPDCHLCFVSKKGYRYRGAAIEFSESPQDDDFEFKIILESADSPGKRALSLISMDAEKRSQATLAVIDEQYRVVATQHSRYWLTQIFDFALKADRQRAVAIAKDAPLNDAKAMMLFKLGEIDEAIELTAALSTPSSRSRTFLAGASAIEDRGRKKQLLLEAAFQAKAIQNVGSRVEAYASIIEALYDNGNEKTASNLSKLALPLAETLGNDGRGPFGRGWLARSTVEMFPDRSVALIDSIVDQNSRNRHLGNLAHEMAAVNPELAETLLTKIEKSDHHIPPVVHRMGPADLPRAIGLTKKITGRYSSTAYKANAVGALAYAIRESDPEKSRELLSQAFTQLWNQHDHRYSLGVAINLLRFASEIAPDVSDTYFWTTLGLYADPNHSSWGADQRKSESQIHLAKQVILLALFDRLPTVRAAILEPIMADLSEFSDKNDRWFRDSTDRGVIYAAMALTLPEETAQWHAAYYANVPKEATRFLPQPWEVIGHCWTKTGPELADYIVSELEHDWVIEKEDF